MRAGRSGECTAIVRSISSMIVSFRLKGATFTFRYPVGRAYPVR